MLLFPQIMAHALITRSFKFLAFFIKNKPARLTSCVHDTGNSKKKSYKTGFPNLQNTWGRRDNTSGNIWGDPFVHVPRDVAFFSIKKHFETVLTFW